MVVEQRQRCSFWMEGFEFSLRVTASHVSLRNSEEMDSFSFLLSIDPPEEREQVGSTFSPKIAWARFLLCLLPRVQYKYIRVSLGTSVVFTLIFSFTHIC